MGVMSSLSEQQQQQLFFVPKLRASWHSFALAGAHPNLLAHLDRSLSVQWLARSLKLATKPAIKLASERAWHMNSDARTSANPLIRELKFQC